MTVEGSSIAKPGAASVTLEREREPEQVRGPGRRARLGLAPLSVPGNTFCTLFADSLGDAFETRDVPFKVAGDWRAIARLRLDCIVMHWPTYFFRPISRRRTMQDLAWMALARARGTRFVWVVHNLTPHDGGSLESRLTASLFVAQLSGLVHLSDHSREALRQRYRVRPWTRELVTAHGTYPMPDGRTIAPKSMSGSRAPRLLAFGHVRPYKRLPQLASAAREAGVRLTVAGRVWSSHEADALREAAGDDPNIVLDLRDQALHEDELEALIAYHDGVVLPHGGTESLLNSGAALHALSRARPVLAPRLGALPELAGKAGPGWVSLFSNAVDAADLRAFAESCTKVEGVPRLDDHEWSVVGSALTDFLSELIAAGPSGSIAAR